MERRVIMVFFLTLLGGSVCLAEKLAPNQKAPPFAKGSGGLALKAPFEGGGGAADVGRRRAQTNPAPPKAPSAAVPQVDGVVREETEELKEVDGQLVRVVKGSYAYDSPEGLPISVKYVADENGNRASFTFGTGKPGGSRPSGGQGVKKPGLTPGGPGATSLGGGGNTGGQRPGGGSGNSGGGRPGGGSGNSGSGRPGGGAGNAGGGRPGGSGSGGASTYLPPTNKVDRSYLPPN